MAKCNQNRIMEINKLILKGEMEMSPRERLQTAVELIEQIQQQLQELYAIVPDLRSNDSIEQSINRCHAAFQQAGKQLAKPALRIATIGTTSAGKSTLVNGLIGRQIAPMDAGELSAGVLHLIHHPDRRLRIKPVENYWEGVDRSDLTDSQMYEHVREQIFKKYHEVKQKHTIPVPEVCIEGPLLPAAWPELLNLPENVGIEIYDLPGLNSIADKTNLAVIQNHLKQCFSLVVMDYSHTDTSNRANLLKEVAEVVNALGGSTDTLLFALNRVDSRNQTDDPLENRLKDFSEEIQKQLQLSELPEIVPISGLPLFYAQCAWGWSKPEGEPVTDIKQQKACLRPFRLDCATFIALYENDEISDWFFNIKKATKDGNDIPNELLAAEKLLAWVLWSWEYSGGAELWKQLRRRIAVRFAEVVIAPILINPFHELEVVLSQLNDYDRIQRLENEKDVVNQKKALERHFDDLQKFFSEQGKKYQIDIQSVFSIVLNNVSTINGNCIGKTASSMDFDKDKLLFNIFIELRNLDSQVIQDLIDRLIIPARDYFKNGELTSKLQEKLQVLPPETRQAILDAAEGYRVCGMVSDAVAKGIAMKVCRDNTQSIKKLYCTRKAVIKLFAAMRQGLAQRASFMLQSHHKIIVGLQHDLHDWAMENIQKYLQEFSPDEAHTLLALCQRNWAEIPPDPIPDSAFDSGIDDLVSPRNSTDTVESHKWERVETGSCFKDTEVIKKPVHENVEYIILKVPNIDDMAHWWMEGINKGRSKFWEVFGNWLEQSVQAQCDSFKKSANIVHEQLNDLLNQRLQQNEENYRMSLNKLNELKQMCQSIQKNNQSLHQTTITLE